MERLIDIMAAAKKVIRMRHVGLEKVKLIKTAEKQQHCSKHKHQLKFQSTMANKIEITIDVIIHATEDITKIFQKFKEILELNEEKNSRW